MHKSLKCNKKHQHHQRWFCFPTLCRLKKVDLLILGSGFSVIREAESFERCCVELATAPASGKEVAEALGGPFSKVAAAEIYGNFWGIKICLKTITALRILMFYRYVFLFCAAGGWEMWESCGVVLYHGHWWTRTYRAFWNEGKDIKEGWFEASKFAAGAATPLAPHSCLWFLFA